MDTKQHLTDVIKVLFPGSCVAEIRIPKAGKMKTVAGYFELPDNIDKMVEAAMEFDGFYNIYWTINPCNRALLARAANRIKPYAESLTDDSGIIHRNWLPIDFDPNRFAGISSSNEEKALAKAKMFEVTEWLSSQGWPEPIKANSGNGYHALYRIDLPNDDLSRDLISNVIKALADKFDDSHVSVDQTVFNAGRVLKAYGTVAVKGDSIPERPHRYSKMVIPSEPVQTVSNELLEAVAALAPIPDAVSSSPSRGGGWTKAMVESGLTASGVTFRQAITTKIGLKWQHDCFNDPSHSCPDAFTTLDHQGWVSCKCSHNSCLGKSMNAREWGDKVEKMTGKKIDRPVYKDTTKYFEVEDVD